MGGGQSTVKIDPELEKQLKAMNKFCEELKKEMYASNKKWADTVSTLKNEMEMSRQVFLAQMEESRKKADAKIQDLEAKLKKNSMGQEEYKAKKKELFYEFLQDLKSGDSLQQVVLRRNINVCFVGKVSGGKSSLINAIAGDCKVAKTGRGRTTSAIALKYELKGDDASGYSTVSFYDAPGDDPDFSYLDKKICQVLALMHIFVFVYDDTTSNCNELIELALALGKAVIFVRNKLDNGGDDDEPWEQTIEEDRARLCKEVSIREPVVFGISAHNAMKSKQDNSNTQQSPTFQFDAFLGCVKQTASAIARSQGTSGNEDGGSNSNTDHEQTE